LPERPERSSVQKAPPVSDAVQRSGIQLV
jgi:hypothetical protein